MSHLASPWKIQQHRSASVSNEMGQVGPPCHRRQLQGRICSTTSRAPDNVPEEEGCDAKATELCVFIGFIMSETWFAHEMEFTASGVGME